MAVSPGDLLPALAGARDAATDGYRMVSVVVPARLDVDCSALFTLDTEVSFVWEQPDREVHIAARGAAASLTPETGDDRFGEAARWLRDVVEGSTVVHLDRTPVDPIAVAGFSFADATDWSFGPRRAFVPELTYVRRDGRAAWIRSIGVGSNADVDVLAADLATELTRLHDIGGGWLAPRPMLRAHPYDPADADYPKLVRRALEEIAAEDVSKIVLARSVDVDLEVDFVQLLATLRHRYPGCATFAYSFDGVAFVGATPELLLRRRGDRIETAAVAGTFPRGSTFDEDHDLGRALLHVGILHGAAQGITGIVHQHVDAPVTRPHRVDRTCGIVPRRPGRRRGIRPGRRPPRGFGTGLRAFVRRDRAGTGGNRGRGARRWRVRCHRSRHSEGLSGAHQACSAYRFP